MLDIMTKMFRNMQRGDKTYYIECGSLSYPFSIR